MGATLAALTYPAQAAVSPAQSPLFLTVGAPPNITVTLDDSGSMRRAFVPEVCGDASNCDYLDNRYGKAAHNNALYYNPTVTYIPPKNANGTSRPSSSNMSSTTNLFTTVYRNGFDTAFGTVDLSLAYRPTANLDLDPGTNAATEAYMDHYSGDGLSLLVPAYYYVFDASNSGCTGTAAQKKEDNDCYDRTIVSATSGSGGTDERQNFANWYAFYRTRNLATVSGASIAFAGLDPTYRVAWQALNTCRGSATSLVDTDCDGWKDNFSGKSNAIKTFTGTHKTNFFDWLFQLPTNGGTPLREAMTRVGEYYKTSGENSPYDNNFTTGSSGEYSCRKNAHILMTDGIWNDSGISIGNVDNASATLPDTKSYAAADPYNDSYLDTLADVAFKYWSTDLRTLTNDVTPNFIDPSGGAAPTNKTVPSTWTNAQYFNPKNNPATWQHMVNYTIGLGLTDFLADAGLVWTGDMYAGSFPNILADTTQWPDANGTMGSAGATYGQSAHDLWHAAINSRGRFFSVESPDALTQAFSDILSAIASDNTSASSVATNSTRLDTSAVVYQAKLDSRDWSGHLLAFDINNTEDLNGNGMLDAGEDVNGNSVLDTGNGTIGAQLWDAGASGKIPAASRNVVTYNPSASTAPRGVDFLWASLTATQQAALNANTTIGSGVTAGNVGQKTLDYIRGDQAQEQTTGPFRKRTAILGDIVNSDPWFVGSEDFNYGSLPGTEGSSYVTFRNGSTYQQRRRMLYFGANDGMLHGIDVGSYSSGTFNTGTGAEMLAYVPDAVIPNLKNLSSPSYTHQYFVDGSPKAADAYINSAWKTVLLGTTGAGGKAVFALDVTAPDSFGSSNVLWEISTTTSPTASDRTTDDTSVAGFQNNLGYTLSQPSLVRMSDGSWAAIVANGYGSVNNKAVLYIIDAATGNLIRSIDTQAGSSTAGSENGLSTPIALDVDNDRITDYIYAGDLKGNLWKFDVTNSTPSQWDVAYKSGSTPKPLYVACTSSSAPCASANLQPITAKPQVGKVGAGQTGGLMVYFGTGKYFESGDTSTTQTQTFYGIWDKCDKTSSAGCDGQVSGRDSLQQQAITQELAQGGFNLRVTSNCTVNYGSTPLSGAVSAPCTTTANRLGWYMDFIQPASSNLPANSDLGERVVSAPILRDGRIIFTTLIPSTDPCAFGGTGWLMELGSTSGQRLGLPPWDINEDGKIDSNDLVTSGGSGVAPSGKQSKVGIIKAPGIISAGTQEYKYTSGSTGSLEVTLESAGISSGRKAWRQLR